MRLRWAVAACLAAFAGYAWLAYAQIQNEVIESGGYHRYPGGIAIGDPNTGVGCLNWSQSDLCFFLDSNCNFQKDIAERCYCLCTTTSTSSSTSSITTTVPTTTSSSTSVPVSSTMTTAPSTSSLPPTSTTSTSTSSSTSTTTTTLVFALLGGTSSTSSNASPYLALSMYDETVCTTFTTCATYIEHDEVLTSWSIQMVSALTGDQQVTGSIITIPPGGGAEVGSLPIVLTSASGTGGVTSGTLSIPAGSQMAVKMAFTGTAFTSKNIRTMVFAMQGSPFLAEAMSFTSTPTGAALTGMGNQVLDGGDFEQSDNNAMVSGSVNPLPGNVRIPGASIHLGSTLTTASSWDLHQSQGGSTIGTIDVLANVQNGVTDIFSWPFGANWGPIAAQADFNNTMNYWKGNVSATRRAMIATRYLPASPYTDYSVILSGLGWVTNSWGGIPTTFYITPDTDEQTSTAANVGVMRWPNLPGTFKYLVAYGKANFAAPNTLTMTTNLVCGTSVPGTIRIAAASGTWSLASTDNPIWARNDVSAYHVVQDDLCYFTSVWTGGGAPAVRFGASIGFLPDTSPFATTTTTSTSSTTSSTL